MKTVALLLQGVFLFLCLGLTVSASPNIGHFSADGVKFQPADFMIVHEVDEERIRLHFTDLTLNEEQKKYLAGNRGNNFSENTIQFYIPMQRSGGRVVQDTSQDVQVYAFGKISFSGKLPAEHFTMRGDLKSLFIQARGQTQSRRGKADYIFRVQGKVYSSAERARKTYPEIVVGDQSVVVNANWNRGPIKPMVGVSIHQGNGANGQNFDSSQNISQLVNALKTNRPHKYNGLTLTPQNGGFLLQLQGPRGYEPREAFITREQAQQIASQVIQAATHLGLWK